MKIKLYDQLPVAEIAQTDPTPHDSSCSRCPLGVDGRSRCVPATGAPGGLYVLGGPVTSYEALAYGPFESRQGQLVRQLIHKSWNGPVVFDHAVRCQGSEDGEGVDECRTFTSHNYALSRASRVLLIGIRAAQSLLGKRILYDLDYESAQGGYFWLTPTLPAFFMPDVTYKADNPILMREWGALLERCLTRPTEDLVVHPAVRGITARLVTTVEEATAAADALRSSGEPVTYDVETDGELGNPDFRVISLALYCRGLQDVYVWASGHIYGAEVVPALKLLADPRVTLLGQNAKFDRTAILRTFKVEVEAVNIDTMLTQRLRFADRAANLDVLSYLVGQGGYKSEIAALQDGVKKHLKKVDKVGKVARAKKFNWDAYVNKHVALVDLVRYNARDVVATADAEHMQRQWLAEPGIRQQAATRTRKQLVIPADHCAGWLEHYGAYVDRDRLNYLRQRLNAEEATVLPRLGGINANSPIQVRNRIFDSVAAGGLGLKPPTKKRTDSGLISTDDKTISALLEQHPHIDFLRAVLDYRGISKLRGTYVDGLEAFIRQDGRVHPNYKLDGTETGRASCENPNLYNIPRTSTEYGRLIRGAFRAMSDADAKRFGAVPLPGDPNDDVLLVQADYSQQELRVAAVLSRDREMAAIFKSGVDYHMRTAEILAPMVWGISPEKWVQMGLDYKEAKAHYQSERAAGREASEVKDPRKKYRDSVKAVNFGLAYGKSDASLAEDIGCTVEEAAAIRATILGKFSSLAAWMEEQRQFARRNGGVWTWWERQPARWRPLPDIGSPHDNRRAEAERACVNSPIQGTASDYCLSSLSVIEAMLRREKAPARPIFSVYDSIIFEARRSFIPTLVERARYVMENLWDSGDVPLVADFEVADGEARWGVMVPYETWRS